MNLLEIRDLRVSFAGFSPVRGISLAIKSGEFVALVGNSGSGKSTVAHSLLKLQDDAKYSGKILFKKQDLIPLDEASMQQIRGGKIAMIFQEPMSSLNPLHTAGAQILEALRLHTHEATKERVFELLRLVELTDTERFYNAYPHTLSGGQRQRIMIAMALAGAPDLLIADEPTTALDVSIQAQILTLLKNLQQKLNLSILFITHDLDIVRQMADRVYVMKFGRIIATRVPAATPPPPHQTLARRLEPPLLQVKDLAVFYDHFEAVHPLSFRLFKGETIGILGESGSGKSSLAKGLVRLLKTTGSVFLEDKNFLRLSGKALKNARADIQMVFQDPFSSLNPRMTIADIVAEGLSVHHRGNSLEKVAEALKQVALKPEIMPRYPHELSGGQRTRVALARALILRPKVLILDEVTSSLDIYTQQQLIHLLNTLQKEMGLAYLFISHDMKVMRQMADYVLVMKDGKVVEAAPAETLFTAPKHPYTQRLIKAGSF